MPRYVVELRYDDVIEANNEEELLDYLDNVVWDNLYIEELEDDESGRLSEFDGIAG
jgi:hypothetical protein